MGRARSVDMVGRMGHWAEEGALRARGLALLALCDVVGLLLVAQFVGLLIDHMAVHLCGWPATVSCDRGLPVVWTALRVFVWGCVLLASADLIAFVRNPTPDAAGRVKGWAAWGPAVVLVTFNRMADRELEAGDIVLGSALLLVALVLVGRTVAERTAVPERRIAMALAPIAMVIATTLAWAPAAFTAVERAEEARKVRQSERYQDVDPDMDPGLPPEDGLGGG